MYDTTDDIEKLYDTFADPIYRFLCWHTGDSLLAEDLTSEVFIRAWKHREKLKDNESKAWLYRVAKNLVTDYFRRKHETIDDEMDTRPSGYNVHEAAETAETNDKLHKALSTLSFEHRTIVILRFFEQLSAKEVAIIIEKSEGNVRLLQHRALKELKKNLTI